MKVDATINPYQTRMLQVPSRPNLAELLPAELCDLSDPQRAMPAIAKDQRRLSVISNLVARVPTEHVLVLSDARDLTLPENSVHLAVTSPPYWTLKKYRDGRGQLGHIADYEEFLNELDRIWNLSCARSGRPSRVRGR